MTKNIPKIVVITPIKNEEWILDRFLSVTSQFADHIIIADQNSTDNSIDICKRYPKVTLIANKSDKFNEAERQLLLINTARELVPEHKILLALDADEILAANATQTSGWQAMLRAKPGTVLCFEKPELYLTPDQCLRYDYPWPLGYVDDGAEHQPKKIHSIRIPQPEYSSILHIHDVKILHYALSRISGQQAKMRYYSVLENIFSTHSLITRRRAYVFNRDVISKDRLSQSPKEWFCKWEELGIDMHTVENKKYYWQDFEVLKYFSQYGYLRFWFDDIWKFDWESCRLYAKSLGIENIPDNRIFTPPKYLDKLSDLITKCLVTIKSLLTN
ncbi:glycosyltransferase family 2 protein [Calothrix sp. PCC 7507]|uniref:glycosyltransferase family 2 protein n=1 Tax=Calothrix sp. PCC 7507 TaxID=99598 RepID=UPI00029EC8EC|nr:glycosyltransferase family 2 protein [Calothrix sp. PCC 7507]AFY30866.1 glycosyl transferase family 2 [Calothrix sp. PCC 7507]